jgi:hypothetical protein
VFGKATPVERISSPPRRRWAMSATSLTCTHRTGRLMAFAAASIVGCPLRICGRTNISATVGRLRAVRPVAVAPLISGIPRRSSRASGGRSRHLNESPLGVRCSLETLPQGNPIHSARKLNEYATHCSWCVAPKHPTLRSVCRSMGLVPSD